MTALMRHLKRIVAALLVVAMPALAQAADPDMDELYKKLADPDNADWAICAARFQTWALPT